MSFIRLSSELVSMRSVVPQLYSTHMHLHIWDWNKFTKSCNTLYLFDKYARRD